MKKTLIILLCLILQLALVGCAGTKADTQTEQSSNETPAPAVTDVLEGNLGTGVSEVGGADTPDGTSVVVKPQCPPAYGVSFRLPSDWTYEVEQTDDEPTSTVRVVIRPVEPGMEGEISFYCSDRMFGVCGTGLEQKDIIFNGHEAWQGFYDGSPLWNFICLKDLPGCAVINSAENWYEDYADVIDQILPTVEFVYYDSENRDITPSDMVDSLFASGDITLTLHLANDGACNSYPANEWYSGRLKVLLDGYSWTRLEMPLTEPSEFWLTAASADGTIKMTFWSNIGAGMVQYSDGNASSFWSATPADDSQESIAKDIRMEYDNLDVDFSRIAFGMEGTAEDAADYFVHTAFGEHMASLEPGSIYGISEYEVVQWTVRETSESGDAVVGSLKYAFTPWDFNSPGIWAGNTAEGTDDYEGKLTCYREFVLQQQEDGFWHCIGLGTGGYTLPK